MFFMIMVGSGLAACSVGSVMMKQDHLQAPTMVPFIAAVVVFVISMLIVAFRGEDFE